MTMFAKVLVFQLLVSSAAIRSRVAGPVADGSPQQEAVVATPPVQVTAAAANGSPEQAVTDTTAPEVQDGKRRCRLCPCRSRRTSTEQAAKKQDAPVDSAHCEPSEATSRQAVVKQDAQTDGNAKGVDTKAKSFRCCRRRGKAPPAADGAEDPEKGGDQKDEIAPIPEDANAAPAPAVGGEAPAIVQQQLLKPEEVVVGFSNTPFCCNTGHTNADESMVEKAENHGSAVGFTTAGPMLDGVTGDVIIDVAGPVKPLDE